MEAEAKPIATWLVELLAQSLQAVTSEIDPSRPIVESGLDSLGALGLKLEIETRFGVDVPVASFLEGWSIDRLAAEIRAALSGSTAARGVRLGSEKSPVSGDDEEHPLSKGQEALWFLHALAPESPAYNLTQAIRVRGPLEVRILRGALETIVARHPALRTTFRATAHGPVARVGAPAMPCVAEVAAEDLCPEELTARLEDLANTPFDLERGPLLRITVLRRGDLEHVLVISAHHMIADLWSLSLFIQDLARLYPALARGERLAPEAEPAAAYADFARWQAEMLASERGRELGGFWEKRLAGASTTLELPSDRPRPRVRAHAGATHAFIVDEALSARVVSFALDQGTTPYVVLLSALQALLHRWSGQDDILVASPAAGRTRPEWARVIGYFANSIVQRADLADDPSFLDLVAAQRRSVTQSLDHQDLPVSTLIDRLRVPRDPGRSPLFQVLFALQKAPAGDTFGVGGFALGSSTAAISFAGLTLQPIPLAHRGAQLDLELYVAESSGRFYASLQYDRDLFDEETMVRFARHWMILLEGAVGDPSRRISQLPMLSDEERSKVLNDWNRTEREIPSSCVHDLCETNARQRPHALAVSAAGAHLTYAELDRRANGIARRLIEAGVQRGDVVAVALERTPLMVSALLGIHKSGAAYLPLDPTYPRDRLAFMLEDSGASLLCTEPHLVERIPGGKASLLLSDADGGELASDDASPALPPVAHDDLAYVIYTSGSTGQPKGVEVTHGSLANFLHAMRECPGVREDDVVLALTTLSFDIAALEIFLPLAAGARIELVDRETAMDGAKLAQAIRSSRATTVQATPATWRLLLAAGWEGSPDLRVLCGGEALPRTLADALLARAACVWNLYGPTETTVWSSVHRVTAGSGAIPIGRPIANTSFYVLDSAREPVLVGAVGEIWIGGRGVARGYRDRPELSADRFLADPFAKAPEARMYRTGDLGRWRSDGSLECLGRVDHQVKIRGFRVEVGEIEAALSRHPAVREAVVVAPSLPSGERRLVGYYVPRDVASEPAALRHALRAELPDYLVPSFLVPLAALPLTPNGKVDRRALPPPEPRGDGTTPTALPRTELESRLLPLWRDVLGGEIGVHDNFFESGGDSLRAAELVARMSIELSRPLPVKLLLLHPTVSMTAFAIEHEAAHARQQENIEAPSGAPDPAGARLPADALPRSPRGIEIEHRPLLSLVTTGAIPTVDAAALASIPLRLLAESGLGPETIVRDWLRGVPTLIATLDVSLGRIGLILLPRFDFELHADPAGTTRDLVDAAALAGAIGARAVSLTGLLPSATRYGLDLADALASRGAPPGLARAWPRLTTGHATTAAAVVLSLQRALARADRDIAAESVAILGLGSIGTSALRLMLDGLPHPASLLLCDLPAMRPRLEAIADELRSEHDFRGAIRVLSTTGANPPSEIYDAGLILGATSVADVVDVRRLRPGTIVVDDSAPHCFSVDEALRRMKERGDVLFTEGGTIHAPEDIRAVRHLPPAAALTTDVSQLSFFSERDPREITGCILSSLLTARFDVEPTLGLADRAACASHLERLVDLGFAAPDPHLEGRTLPTDHVRRFREGHGRSAIRRAA